MECANDFLVARNCSLRCQGGLRHCCFQIKCQYGLYLKGYSGFKNPFSRLSFFGFKIIFDHMRVHIPNIGSLAHS